jgi:hypothetical protein
MEICPKTHLFYFSSFIISSRLVSSLYLSTGTKGIRIVSTLEREHFLITLNTQHWIVCPEENRFCHGRVIMGPDREETVL